jgi:hypothetical protein
MFSASAEEASAGLEARRAIRNLKLNIPIPKEHSQELQSRRADPVTTTLCSAMLVVNYSTAHIRFSLH